MTVWGWLAQTPQQLLVLEQRTLKIRGNPRAMPCSWRLAVLPAMSLEQDLLHQTDFFFSCSVYQLWLIFLLLFKSIFTGVLTWTTRLCKLWNEYVSPKDFWVCISRLYSAVNLYLLGEGVNSREIDPRVYLNSPQKSGLEMEIRERNSHPYSPSDIKYLKSTNSKAEANPLAFKAKGVGGNTHLHICSITRNEAFKAATGHTKHAVHTIKNEWRMDAERKRQGRKEGRKERRKEKNKVHWRGTQSLDFNQLKNVLLNIVVIQT